MHEIVDSFALLNQERRPWLEPEGLKAEFLRISAALHPDRVHSGTESEKAGAQQRYAELNAAYRRLEDPKTRLQHLLELERGRRPDELQEIPAGLMEVFVQFAQLLRGADEHVSRMAATESPLLKVQLFDDSQFMLTAMGDFEQRMNVWGEQLLKELQEVDAAWDNGRREELLGRIEQLYRLFGFRNRWAAQARERILRLTM